ncbi:MAG: tetratricopeptide repeat protein [Muribaculaceae bacterium]|nr:tetratricopeptide repeat protein [Muribaculaceae bacterium]
MKLSKLFVLLLLTIASSTMFNAAAQNDEKYNAAIMKVYNEYIAKNPNDYNTLFMRANQNFLNHNYDAAMADVNRTLEMATSKDTELLFDAYMLRAKLHDINNNLEAEGQDIEKAAQVNPTSLAWVDLKGKWAYRCQSYDVAKQQFQAILQQQPRNYDAMFCLGCVAAKEGKADDAMKWVNQAVTLFPAEAQVYANRAYVQELLGKYRDASDTYLIAMSTTDDNGSSIEQLFRLADSHYDDVMASLRSATDDNPRVGIFYRVRSAIALKYKHYGQALRDLRAITDNNLMEYASIYNDEAQCLFQLGDYDQAYTYANKAIANDATSPDGYILRSMIELRQGKGNNYNTAMQTLDQALVLNPNYAPTLLAKARLLIAQKKYKDAATLLDKAVVADPTSADALLLRGWLNKNHLKSNTAANADFEKILTLPDDDMTSLRGFALHELGRDSEANAWAENKIKELSATGGETYYYAAALQAAMGNKAQGIKYLESCLANGYGGLYDIKFNEAPYVNLSALRSEPTFNMLVNNSQLNFQER